MINHLRDLLPLLVSDTAPAHEPGNSPVTRYYAGRKQTENNRPISQEFLDIPAADVRAAGRRAVQIRADIGDPDAAALIAAQAQAALGDVHIVVNNAATVTPIGPTAVSTRTSGPAPWP